VIRARLLRKLEQGQLTEKETIANQRASGCRLWRRDCFTLRETFCCVQKQKGVFMRAMSLMLAIMLSCLALAGPVAADIKYVDAANTGEQDGSPEHPFVTIGQALAVRAGEIRVAEGNYPESIVVYPGLLLRGGYEAAGWTRDWRAYPAVIVGQEQAAVSSEADVAGNEISGFRITGLAGVTACGICLDGIAGDVLVVLNEIYGIIGPAGADGEYCDYTPEECAIDPEPAPAVFGIRLSGAAGTILSNDIHDLSGGPGGMGGVWAWAMGHSDGGNGGAGGAAVGIEAAGVIQHNMIAGLTGGAGGLAADGFDDTGYGALAEVAELAG